MLRSTVTSIRASHRIAPSHHLARSAFVNYIAIFVLTGALDRAKLDKEDDVQVKKKPRVRVKVPDAVTETPYVALPCNLNVLLIVVEEPRVLRATCK